MPPPAISANSPPPMMTLVSAARSASLGRARQPAHQRRRRRGDQRGAQRRGRAERRNAGAPCSQRAQRSLATALTVMPITTPSPGRGRRRVRPSAEVERDRRRRRRGAEQHRPPGVGARVERAHDDLLRDPRRHRQAEQRQDAGDLGGVGGAERAVLVDERTSGCASAKQPAPAMIAERETGLHRAQDDAVQLARLPSANRRDRVGSAAAAIAWPTTATGTCMSRRA